MMKTLQTIKLPEPWYRSEVSLEEAIQERRSERRYNDLPLEMNQIGQLCWAAQGKTSSQGFRSSPSAGALETTLGKAIEIKFTSRNVKNVSTIATETVSE